MKRRNLLYALLTILLPMSYVVFSSNSGGVTGNSTNGCSCHGTNLSTTTLSVTGIPNGEYTPGQTYNLTISVTNPNFTMAAARAGFNVTCTEGSFMATSGVQVSTTNNKEITHDGAAAMSAGVATWTASWTAPAAGAGIVTFHMAGNATNGNNGTGGDQPNYDPFPFAEAVATSVTNFDKNEFVLYPNPVSDKLNLDMNTEIVSHDINLFSLAGQLVKLPAATMTTKGLQLDASQVSAGAYVLFATVNNKRIVQKVIIK